MKAIRVEKMEMGILMHKWLAMAMVLLLGAESWAQTSTSPAEVSASSNLEPYSAPYVRHGPPLLRVRSSFDRLPGSGPFVGGLPEKGRHVSGRVDALFRGTGVLPLKLRSPGGLGAPRSTGARLPGRPREMFGRLGPYTNLGTLPHRSGKVGRLP